MCDCVFWVRRSANRDLSVLMTRLNFCDINRAGEGLDLGPTVEILIPTAESEVLQYDLFNSADVTELRDVRSNFPTAERYELAVKR